MRFSSQLGSLISGTAALAMLAACSGGSTGTSPSAFQPVGGSTGQSVVRRPRMAHGIVPLAMRNAIRTPHVSPGPVTAVSRLPFGPLDFVSDFSNNEIYVLSSSGRLIGTLNASTGLRFPQGMSVTNNPRALYVANSGADNILVYTSATAVSTLNDPNQEPGDVSVDSSGNVAAENYDGSVSCYVGGATSPSFTIGGTSGTGTFYNIFFGAFDAAGNLYIDGFDYDGYAVVGEIVGGCQSSNNTVTDLTTANTLLYAGGVQVTSNGTISIEDQQALTIYTYNPPSGTSLGSPVATTPLTGSSDPVSFSLTQGSGNALTADDGLTNANVYAFPMGGSPEQTFTLPGATDPIGTALYPSEQY